MPRVKNVYWLYSILTDNEDYGINRDDLMNKLAENCVEIRRFFYPLHLVPPYKGYAVNYRFPITERLSSSGINLPSSVKLTEKETYEVAQLTIHFHRE